MSHVGKEPIGDLADVIIEHAMAGLARRGLKDQDGNDERQYVEPIAEFVRERQSIGQMLIKDCIVNGEVSLDKLAQVMAY